MAPRLSLVFLFALITACGEDVVVVDAGLDGGVLDAALADSAVDAASDAGLEDAGLEDAGLGDAAVGDAGPASRLTLTFTTRINPMVDAFDTIERREVTCEITFPTPTMLGSPPRIELSSGPTSVACSPNPPAVVGRMAENLDGEPALLVIFGTTMSPTNGLRFEITGAPGAEVFRAVATCDAIDFPHDGMRPVLRPFSCAGGSIALERYSGSVSPSTLTEQASGVASLAFADP